MMSRPTSYVPKDDVVFRRLHYRDSRCSKACRGCSQTCRRTQTCCRCSQTCRRHSQICRQRSQACCRRTQTCHRHSHVLQGAPKVLSGAPSCSQTYPNHSHGTSVPVIRARSYSKGRPERPPTVWYSSEIDASKFPLHILSDTPGGFQWLKLILLMKHHWDSSEHKVFLKDGQHSSETCWMLYLQKEIMQREPTGSSWSTISPNIDEWRAINQQDSTTCRLPSHWAIMVWLQ